MLNKDAICCERAFQSLCKKFKDNPNSLSEYERDIGNIYDLVGHVGGEGLEGYLSSDFPWCDTIEALKKIGCDGPASAVQFAIEIFPDGIPPVDQQVRQNIINKILDKDRDYFLKYNQQIWDEEDSIIIKLAVYIRSKRIIV